MEAFKILHHHSTSNPSTEALLTPATIVDETRAVAEWRSRAGGSHGVPRAGAQMLDPTGIAQSGATFPLYIRVRRREADRRYAQTLGWEYSG